MKKYALFIVLLLSALCAVARNTPCQHYSKADGLPSNTIYDIYRDSRGYLWIATDKGIAKFNGVKFQVYTTSNGLPDNEIFSFTEDHDGRLWLATLNGELCYYKNDTFHNAKNTPFLKMPFKASFIKTIKVEKDSTVTIVFADQIRFINLRKDKCRFFVSDVPYRSTSIWYVTKQNPNLFRLTFHDKTIYMDSLSRVLDVDLRPDSTRKAHLYCQDREYSFDRHYVYLNNVRLLQIDSQYFALIRPPGKTLNRVFYDEGKTFLLTSGGLNVNNNYHLFVGQTLSSITRDAFGNYWIGTLGNGLCKLPKGFLNNTVYDSVYKGEVKYLTNVQNRIFFALSDINLYQWKPLGAVKIFDHRKMSGTSTSASDPFFFLSDKLRYYSFCSTENIVVDNVDKITAPKMYKSGFIYGSIKAMYEPEDNIVYVQNHYRMGEINYPNLKNREEILNEYTIVSDSVFDNRIFCTAEDVNHGIWYSSNRGIFKVAKGRRQQFSNVSFKQFAFIGGRLIGYTHDNLLLVGRSVGTVSNSYDTVNSDNCIWNHFYPIDSRHLLISTNNFYRVLSIGNSKVTMHIVDDEWVPLDVEGITCDSNLVYFFKNGNVTSIAKQQLLTEHAPPVPIITGIRFGNHQLWRPTGNNSASNVELTFEQARNVTIMFSALSFNSPNVTYEYAISKSGKINWVDAGDGQVNLINPGYGSYNIWVRAKTLSSTYSTPKLIQLTILRPFWATWWFISCAILLVGAVVVYVARSRINAIVRARAKENENKMRYLKSEYKALNALMNPHFIFNTLNNVQGLVNKDDKRAANEYLRIFADLVRQNMHNVSMEMISLEKELDLISNYLLLEKLRFKENLHYVVTIDPGIDTSEIKVPPLLIQPIVENSIKHGILPLESASGVVKIDISEKDSVLQIRVADNGVGLNSKDHKKDSAHISFGLDNIRRRIEQLSAILEKKLIFEMKEEVIGDQKWTVALIFIPT